MQTWLKSFYRTAPATLIITSACIILWLVAALSGALSDERLQQF